MTDEMQTCAETLDSGEIYEESRDVPVCMSCSRFLMLTSERVGDGCVTCLNGGKTCSIHGSNLKIKCDEYDPVSNPGHIEMCLNRIKGELSRAYDYVDALENYLDSPAFKRLKSSIDYAHSNIRIAHVIAELAVSEAKKW